MNSHPPLPELSVVVALGDGIADVKSLDPALSALRAATSGVTSELVVAIAGGEADAARLRARHPDVRVEVLPSGTLVPLLWSHGFARTRGRAVAFTIAGCAVEPGWAAALVGALDEGAGGAAGSMAIAPGTRIRDWATFYLRYAPFIAPRPGVLATGDIPGDNAAYRRDLLDRHRDSFADGFWEVDFHRRIRREGERLVFVRGATASVGRGSGIGATLRQRFAHGRHFGGWRVKTGGRAWWEVLLAAPLVPAVLTARIARRVIRHQEHRARLVLSLPILLAFATAWAAGEAIGSIAPRRIPRLREAHA